MYLSEGGMADGISLNIEAEEVRSILFQHSYTCLTLELSSENLRKAEEKLNPAKVERLGTFFLLLGSLEDTMITHPPS